MSEQAHTSRRRLKDVGEAYAIVSIDSAADPIERQKFKATCEHYSWVTPTIGRYKGITEYGWLLPVSTLRKLLKHHAVFFAGQESVLLVSECNKQYATLFFFDGRPDESLGSLKETPEKDVGGQDYTFEPLLNRYFVTTKDNPDGVPPNNGWLSDETRTKIEGWVKTLRARHAGKVSAADQDYIRIAAFLEQEYLSTE